MNQSLTNLVSHSINDIHLFRNYEICQQESQCYLLIPPPRPPMFPKFILPHPSSHHQWTDSFFIIFGLFISLTCTCLLLFLLNLKFQFYHKLQQRYYRTKDTNTIDEPSSFSSIIPTSYNSLTPITITTNQSPSFILTNKSNQSFHQSFNFDHHYCSHPLTYYQQKYQLTPYYYTYDRSSSKIVCQNCLFDTLHRKQQCLCHNFFVPIK